ncbi:meiotic recombination protein REC114 isoform X2 [Antennarius striatus]|uniref:meiotic recombination protein REC114 isoform X2 n=1 Tax=Antennarius striatus TaxID=241820 RepID=UPI0035AF5FC5
MATGQAWKLQRYGRFVPGCGETEGSPWKVFEADGNKPEIVLRLVECGYMLVLQGEECLDRIPLLWASDILKVFQKSDNLMFRFTVKGEGRMMRMQFYGSSKAEAIKMCSSAVEKLMEYIPVTTQANTLPHPGQSSAEGSAPAIQSMQEKAVAVEPEVVQGSVTFKRLTQHFLGETSMTLPEIYCYSSLAQGNLGPILRACLLDPTFPAFVQKVEEELKKLVEE